MGSVSQAREWGGIRSGWCHLRADAGHGEVGLSGLMVGHQAQWKNDGRGPPQPPQWGH